MAFSISFEILRICVAATMFPFLLVAWCWRMLLLAWKVLGPLDPMLLLEWGTVQYSTGGGEARRSIRCGGGPAAMAAVLKVYADRLSQPSRALIIFCRANKIDFEEVRVDIAKGQHRTPEFKKINPMAQVPAIVDGRFRLFESHAILRYLATVFPGVPDHWYPTDLFTRAKIESILDWHHSNLRRGAATFVLHTALGPSLGLTPNPEAAKEGENLLVRSLKTIESVWLKGDAKFLNGNPQPSIADLSLVCEIMQLEVVGDERRDRILEPREKIRAWMGNVKKATSPHFEEAHELIFKLKARLSSAAHGKTVSKL